jgi:hypothetical protein
VEWRGKNGMKKWQFRWAAGTAYRVLLKKRRRKERCRMVEFGQIEKPRVEEFHGKRKLYCVAHVYPAEGAPDEYAKLFERYWDEVERQIEKIESAGKVRKIFCELVTGEGEDALNLIKGINERVYKIVKRRVDEGGVLVPLEKEEILGPYSDWANCLRVVFTEEVFRKVYDFFTDFSEKRLKTIVEAIDGALAENEAGLLIMKDEERARLQFPRDLEVFLITPPSYDDIIRWHRDSRSRKKKEDEKPDAEETGEENG